VNRPIPQPEPLNRSERWGERTLQGATVWLTGLSGSGKSTIAGELAKALNAQGFGVGLLDADNVRFGLNSDLGFSAADREENVRRLGEVAALMAETGLTVIVPAISPYRAGRAHARNAHAARALPFVEVHVATSLAVCEERDPKGLYRAARAGEITTMTGVDAPYEEPLEPEVRITDGTTVPVAVATILRVLAEFRR